MVGKEVAKMNEERACRSNSVVLALVVYVFTYVLMIVVGVFFGVGEVFGIMFRKFFGPPRGRFRDRFHRQRALA